MNAERLLAHYDRIADAPDAISRLRRFVLSLAVRGKLVPQDPNDEPASELLKRIDKEKARLVKAGKIRNPKPATAIRDDELPIALPENWTWLRLCDIGNLSGGMTPSMNRPDFWDGNIVWLSPKDIKADEISDSELQITAKGLSETRLELYPPGCLFMVARSGILKRTFPVSINRVPAAANQDMKVLVPFLDGDERYLQIMFRGLTDFILANLVKTGTTVQSLKYAEFEQQPFPLPPLAEQHRIVGKVDELMALCDRLEAMRAEREATRDKITAASLARLNTPDLETFHGDARFALDALLALTTRRDQIRQLRQTIRSLAVLGNLVPQDPSDEPASELLKRMAVEKRRLGKLREIKRERNPKHVDPKILRFEIKSGWVATTIETILIELQTGPFGSSLHQSDYQIGGVPVVNPASIQNERIVPMEKMAVGASTLKRLSSFRLREGDIVMGRRGEMGRCAVVTKHEVGWLCGTGSLILRFPSFVFGRFLVLLIGSPYVREYLGGSAVGATMQNLNQGILLNLVVGLPPFAEQRRIVAKVGELMSLCDRLEASLAAGEDIRCRLLDALLAEALEPVEGDLEQAA